MKNILQYLNPWWASEKVPKGLLGEYKRQAYEKLVEEANAKEITLLAGPRQVGKTTLFYQIIGHLISTGTNARNILYLNFDEPELRREAANSIRKIFDYYKEYVFGKTLGSQRIYVFLDEAQKMPEWNNQVKFWQDLKLDIKFYVSGSSALGVMEGAGESLLGRIRIHRIYPLSFTELLEISDEKIERGSVEHMYKMYLPKQERFQLLLKRYLMHGGYPDAIRKESPFELLGLYVDLILKRDLLDMADIRDSAVLNDLLALLASQCGSRVSLEKLASTLKISNAVVSKYIDLFEAAFLVKRVYLFSSSEFTAKRKERKVYFIDNGIRNTLLKVTGTENQEGPLAENSVGIKLMQRMAGEPLSSLYFYEQDGRETDFLVVKRDARVLIEVKYQNSITPYDIQRLKSGAKRLKADFAFLVTKNVFEKHENMLVIPLWLFLISYQY